MSTRFPEPSTIFRPEAIHGEIPEPNNLKRSKKNAVVVKMGEVRKVQTINFRIQHFLHKMLFPLFVRYCFFTLLPPYFYSHYVETILYLESKNSFGNLLSFSGSNNSGDKIVRFEGE